MVGSWGVGRFSMGSERSRVRSSSGCVGENGREDGAWRERLSERRQRVQSTGSSSAAAPTTQQQMTQPGLHHTTDDVDAVKKEKNEFVEGFVSED